MIPNPVQKLFGNVRWFTNLETNDNKFLELSCKYNPKDYPKYDNYDAINVNKVETIPIDYDDIMGVPISFLDKYNPNQFEIVGLYGLDYFRTKIYPKQIQHSKDGKEKLVTKLNDTCALKISDTQFLKNYYEVNGELFVATYKRLFVKKLS